ncbi:MAG: hypothetical protein ORO03_04455 [Alphaproteobacteria bacterium]|nr:hypothetical protein [Alphaproteobacteria bacterium]
MSALELVTVRATNPSTGAAGLAVTGNSLIVRDTPKRVWMSGLWQTRTADGNTQIVSPLLHDNLVGIQMRSEAGQYVGFSSMKTPMFAQDQLSVTLIGSAAAEEHSSWLNYYESLPGVDANLITYAELMRRAVDITAVLNTVTPGTTAFGTQVAINATNDQLKANTEYAIIGATIEDGVATIGTHAIRYTGTDFGNLGVGLPGSAIYPGSNAQSFEWFMRLARQLDLPMIPVFNSANKALTFLDAIGAAATSTGVATTLVRLAPQARK